MFTAGLLRPAPRGSPLLVPELLRVKRHLDEGDAHLARGALAPAHVAGRGTGIAPVGRGVVVGSFDVDPGTAGGGTGRAKV